MEFFIIFMIVSGCSAISLEFRHATELLPWREAYESGLCTTSHYFAGYVAHASLQVDIASTLDGITEAWVGLYGLSTKFMKFDGCYMYEDSILNNDTVPKASFSEGEDLVGSCFLFCNESIFGLSKDICYCLATVERTSSALCNVNSYTGIWFCASPGNGVCGGGLIQQTGLRCLCVYRSIRVKFDFGNQDLEECVSYYVGNSHVELAKCTLPKYYVCFKDHIEESVSFQNLQHSWWNAALLCQSLAQGFGDKSAVIHYVESPNSSAVESYWTNKFRKHLYSFLSPGQQSDYDHCVAVRNESGIFKFFLKDCSDKLPALCFSMDSEITLPAKESTSGKDSFQRHDISVSSTTIGKPGSDSYSSLVYSVSESKTGPIFCVFLGIIAIVVLILVMYSRKRNRNVTMKSVKSEKVRTVQKPEPEVVHKAPTNSGGVSETVNVPSVPMETRVYTSLLAQGQVSPEHEYMELNEGDVSMTTKDANHEQSSTPRSPPVGSSNASSHVNDVKVNDDETYNRLHETEDDDLHTIYDHTRNQDVIYDEIQTNSRNSNLQDDVTYDDVADLLI